MRGRRLLGGAAALLVLFAVVVAAALAPVDGGDEEGPVRVVVGEGPTGATILRARDAPPGRPVVVFLHGWGATDTDVYGDWLAHLAQRATVIYPTYQEPPFVDTVSPLTNAILGIRAALEVVDVPRAGLIVAGHSAGGALAADYAASARAAGLPVPVAVYSVYPGRALVDVPARIPAVDPARIPPSVRLVVLAGDDDETVGARFARETARGATRTDVTYRLVRADAVDDHLAPLRSGPAERRAFWAPLDRLIAAPR